jgi:hypothetical protein
LLVPDLVAVNMIIKNQLNQHKKGAAQALIEENLTKETNEAICSQV